MFFILNHVILTPCLKRQLPLQTPSTNIFYFYSKTKKSKSQTIFFNTFSWHWIPHVTKYYIFLRRRDKIDYKFIVDRRCLYTAYSIHQHFSGWLTWHKVSTCSFRYDYSGYTAAVKNSAYFHSWRYLHIAIGKNGYAFCAPATICMVNFFNFLII